MRSVSKDFQNMYSLRIVSEFVNDGRRKNIATF